MEANVHHGMITEKERRISIESLNRMNDAELKKYALSQRFNYTVLKVDYYLELEELANVEIMRRAASDTFYTEEA